MTVGTPVTTTVYVQPRSKNTSLACQVPNYGGRASHTIKLVSVETVVRRDQRAHLGLGDLRTLGLVPGRAGRLQQRHLHPGPPPFWDTASNGCR
jgi:hypothetical protein